MKKKLYILFLLVVSYFMMVPEFAGAQDSNSPKWRPSGNLAGTGYMRAEWSVLEQSHSADTFVYDGDRGFIDTPTIKTNYIGWEFNIVIENFVTVNSFKRGRLQIYYEYFGGVETRIINLSSDGKWKKIGSYDIGDGFHVDVYDFSWTPEADSETITIGWDCAPDKLIDTTNYLDWVILEAQCLPIKSGSF